MMKDKKLLFILLTLRESQKRSNKKGSYSQMKIVCTKSNLLNGVQTVSKAVPNKTTMSILECILVDATENMIKLTANDMELGIETVIEGDIIESDSL